MKRDPLLWVATAAVLTVLASAEYDLARACGFGPWVAAGVPAALDVYALAALRARRDVFAVVLSLIAVNAASHLVAAKLLPVSVPLVVAVSAVAPVVLWRVHRLSEDAPDPVAEPVLETSSAPAEPVAELAELPAEPITLERDPEPADVVPVAPVLGPWQPLAELAGGTSGTDSGTGPDLDDYRAWGIVSDRTAPAAEPAPEPVPPTVPHLVPVAGTGAADIATEDSGNTTFEARVDTVRNWLETEPELTGATIGERLEVSASYGRRVLRHARGDA
ncbi:hypothetical protein OH738_18090 [Streptomyces hirsutus]|uniref:hypothetical protein n=1 Tax=Streptomyces hirsutus TaxID=35620 RepID=UPI00386A3318|nr:hypothetical protein OH738_18090 [Streptomyces hirsutus]